MVAGLGLVVPGQCVGVCGLLRQVLRPQQLERLESTVNLEIPDNDACKEITHVHSAYASHQSGVVKLCEIMGSKAVLQGSASHLDLSRAPYDLYGVKYIDLVSLSLPLPRYLIGGDRSPIISHTFISFNNISNIVRYLYEKPPIRPSCDLS